MFTYFISDFHLGISGHLSSVEREKQICRWIDAVKSNAAAIYFVGDMFDYWFEYRETIPRGYSRFLGKVAELRDANIPVYFFTGNHDMWMFNYFTEQFDIPIYRKPIVRTINNKTFFIGHGDGLGPGDYGYKTIKHIFAFPPFQWLFARLHPNFSLGLMRFFSQKSRGAQDFELETQFHGADKERLLVFAEAESRKQNIDYFIFGHRHLPIDWLLSNKKSRYINLGEWIYATTYAVFDGSELTLKVFENDAVIIHKNAPQ